MHLGAATLDENNLMHDYGHAQALCTLVAAAGGGRDAVAAEPRAVRALLRVVLEELPERPAAQLGLGQPGGLASSGALAAHVSSLLKRWVLPMHPNLCGNFLTSAVGHSLHAKP